MVKKLIFVFNTLGMLLLLNFLWQKHSAPNQIQAVPSPMAFAETFPLQITEMRKVSYPGSDLIIVQILPNGPGYHQYIGSYLSQNLKIFGLLTVPAGPNENVCDETVRTTGALVTTP